MSIVIYTYLVLGLKSDQLDIKIAKIVLEDSHQLNWFSDNESNIRNEVIPINSVNKLSIAKTMTDFYESVDLDADVDALLDEVYKYRTRHEIWFAFRGQDIHEIYICLNNSLHEISCAEEEDFRYEVDIDVCFLRFLKYVGNT